jgi:hypothetical protein
MMTIERGVILEASSGEAKGSGGRGPLIIPPWDASFAHREFQHDKPSRLPNIM